MKTLELIPAYGKKYQTEGEVEFAFIDKQEEFKIIGSSYMSIRDSESLINKGFDRVKIFYTSEQKHFALINLTL